MIFNLKKNACPCCGYLTLESIGHYDLCPVCFWEDDPIQRENIGYEGGANTVSLTEAKANFKKYQAIDKNFINEVRKAYPNEC